MSTTKKTLFILLPILAAVAALQSIERADPAESVATTPMQDRHEASTARAPVPAAKEPERSEVIAPSSRGTTPVPPTVRDEWLEHARAIQRELLDAMRDGDPEAIQKAQARATALAKSTHEKLGRK